jgi:hypothetical protein
MCLEEQCVSRLVSRVTSMLPCMLGMVTSSHKTVSYSLKVPRTYYYK